MSSTEFGTLEAGRPSRPHPALAHTCRSPDDVPDSRRPSSRGDAARTIARATAPKVRRGAKGITSFRISGRSHLGETSRRFLPRALGIFFFSSPKLNRICSRDIPKTNRNRRFNFLSRVRRDSTRQNAFPASPCSDAGPFPAPRPGAQPSSAASNHPRASASSLRVREPPAHSRVEALVLPSSRAG